MSNILHGTHIARGTVTGIDIPRNGLKRERAHAWYLRATKAAKPATKRRRKTPEIEYL